GTYGRGRSGGNYGRTYLALCRALSPGKKAAYRDPHSDPEKRRRLERADKRLLLADKHLRTALAVHPPGSPEVKKARRFFEMEKKRRDKTYRRVLQPSFNDAVYFLGMDISPEDSLRLAGIFAAVSFFLSFVAFVVLYISFPPYGDILKTFLLPLVFVLPVVLFGFLASYPELLAKRVQALSIGRTPEPINYMAMSLRISPSLERAVAFAAENSDEPLASHLKRVLVEVSLRKYYTVEEALNAFAYRWGRWNEDFKRALYAIRSASVENTREGVERSLEKAHSIAVGGAKEKVEEFASSLSGPTTVLFALGVVLPLLIGALIPLQGMKMPEPAMTTVVEGDDSGSAITVVILMDVIFPLATFLYAYHIIGRRPGLSSPPHLETGGSMGGALLSGAAVASLPAALLFVPSLHVQPGLLILLSISLFISAVFLAGTSAAAVERKRIKAMERDLPDALFQIGSRLAEGQPLETAVRGAAGVMKDSAISDLFSEISARMHLTREPLDRLLFGRNGVLRDTPSREIRAAMRTMVEAVEKDPRSAGETLIQMSSYMRDLQKVEHDVRTKLRSVVDMMRTTGVFFAPVVLGVTASMYAMLSREFSSLGSPPSLSTDLFTMVLGVYLFLSVVVTSYFVSNITDGGDRITFRRTLAFSLPTAVAMYIISSQAGMAVMG
ncbi:MAG: type II secretion system F family protein, partial [Thermoplasmata archaeon]|nr:type II secretion system F family protein [Thermoplasmata archaeon]